MPLAKRVIPTLLLDGPTLVKGEGFNKWRRVGDLMQAVKLFNLREVDELLIFNVSGKPLQTSFIDKVSRKNLLPLTVGGGIETLDLALSALHAGADKVTLNSHLARCGAAIAEAIGRQSVVAVIDYVGQDIKEAVEDAERAGAGEIILQSVERDGTLVGYDRDIIRTAAMVASVPLVASGGCSGYEDMAAALDAGADAVAAGALWQFTQATPREAKEFLARKGWTVRLD